MPDRASHDPDARIDWEAFYNNYRKPGYIAGYEILTKLGAGAFGLVFKARKESIGKDYAIKFLKVDDEAVRQAVLRELDSVRYFAQVDHPNLVAIEDKGEVDGIPYIIMAYAGDETLRKRMNDGGLGRADALGIFVQVARGVQALHDRSLVHFDLKPANVYLKGDIARVGDYGLSKLVTQSHNSLSFGRGTPYYMAPEQLKRRGDHSSDIYSLGVLLYEMLVGQPPFRGDSEWEVLRKHESEPVELPPGLGEPERSTIARCLRKEPEQRFASVQELLASLTAGSVAAAPPPAAPAGPARPQASPPPPPPRAMRTAAPPIRRPCGIPLNTAAGHPRYSGRRFFGVSLVMCTLVFIAISMLFSRPSAPWSHGEGFTAPRGIEQTARAVRPAPARERAIVEFSAETPGSIRRQTLDYVEKMASERFESFARKLEKIGYHAVPAIVNKLLTLDLGDLGDSRVAARLDALLVDITGRRSDFAAPGKRDRAIPRSRQRANDRAVRAWAEYWKKHRNDLDWQWR